MICINPKTNNLAKTAKPCKTQCIDWSFNTSLLIDTVALLRPLTKNLKSIWRSSKPAKPIKEVRPRHNLAGQHVAFFETLRNHTLFLKHTHTQTHLSNPHPQQSHVHVKRPQKRVSRCLICGIFFPQGSFLTGLLSEGDRDLSAFYLQLHGVG